MNEKPQFLRSQLEIELELGMFFENRERYLLQSKRTGINAPAPLPSLEEARAVAAEAAADAQAKRAA